MLHVGNFPKLMLFMRYVEKYGAARQSTQHMRTACYITKAIHTHLEYVILTAFPWEQWLCEHASVLPLYGHCLSCICRDSEDTVCSTFRSPNTQFSVNKNKELEF